MKEEYRERLMKVQEICNQVISGEKKPLFADDLAKILLPVVRGQA